VPCGLLYGVTDVRRRFPMLDVGVYESCVASDRVDWKLVELFCVIESEARLWPTRASLKAPEPQRVI